MWGWVGDPDPTSLLNFFLTSEIGNTSDSYYSSPRYDELFNLQRSEQDETKRKEYLKEIQELVYAEAPYHILYYDAELHAYRTDRFGGWTNQPSVGGTPLFGYGPYGYLQLTDLAAASPEPSAEAPTANTGGSPGASPAGTPSPTGSESNSTLLLVGGIVALVVVLAGGLLIMRRRGAAAEEE
jgi:peptide/nickel transport system substrate-binding protein